MSIIKSLQDYLTEYDGMSLVLTDIAGAGPSSYAVAPSGSGVIRRDVLGGVTYQNSYVFLAKEHSSDEVDRKDNYDFLEAFCQWLEERSECSDLPTLPPPYAPVALEVANVLLMEIDDGGVGTYQIQIEFEFEKRRDLNAF